MDHRNNRQLQISRLNHLLLIIVAEGRLVGAMESLIVLQREDTPNDRTKALTSNYKNNRDK